MNKPWFLGGALLVPPVSPGWKNASVFDISTMVKQNADECEKAYDQISSVMPHGSPEEWEAMMAMVVGLATQSEKGGQLPRAGQKTARTPKAPSDISLEGR